MLLASLSRTLLYALPPEVILPAPRALIPVRAVAQFSKLSAGLSFENCFECALERLPGPGCADSRLARQNIYRHL